jgi:hypothetical protein
MIEKLSDYQKLAITTATYPKKYKIIYPTFELIEKTIELKNARGRNNQLKEIGDCFYSFANLTNELKFDIDGLYEDALDALENVIFEDSIDAINSMIETSAKVCGRVKKWLRDEDTKKLPSDDKMIEIEFQIISFLAAMLYICKELGCTWQEVAQITLDERK